MCRNILDMDTSHIYNNDVFIDIRERFHYIILLLIVTLRNMAQFNWNVGERDIACVLLLYTDIVFIHSLQINWEQC